MVIPEQIKHAIIIIWASNSTLGFVPQRTESRDLNRYLYPSVLSNNIHDRQKVEATQMAISVYIYTQ